MRERVRGREYIFLEIKYVKGLFINEKENKFIYFFLYV